MIRFIIEFTSEVYFHRIKNELTRTIIQTDLKDREKQAFKEQLFR